MASLFKFRQNQDNPSGLDGLSFNRAHIDGMPFRGKPMLLKEEEYERAAETVKYGRVRVFDATNPEHAKELDTIIDAWANKWYMIAKFDHHWHTKPDGSVTVMVFVVYGIPVKQLNPAKVPYDNNITN